MKIYKITGYGLTYYGSTTKELSHRKYMHKVLYKAYLNNTAKFITVFNILEKGNEWDIELVENIDNLDNLRLREGYYIKNNDCINKKIECRTIKEYYNDHKDYFDNYNRNYRETNKDYFKNYREVNKQKIKELQNKPFICNHCNITVKMAGKTNHFKSKAHINNTQNLGP